MTKRGNPALAWGINALIGLVALGASNAATAANCSTSILPDRTLPTDSCEYRLLDFAGVSYVHGRLTATWSEEFEILEAYIVADLEVVAAYTPGSSVLFAPDPSRQHQNFMIRGRTRATGEDWLAITPIFCPTGGVVPAPLLICYPDSYGDGCSITSTAGDCGLTATCEGDHGTCTDCGTSKQACCTASTKTDKSCGGTCIKKVVIMTEITVSCPEPPPPPPNP